MRAFFYARLHFLLTILAIRVIFITRKDLVPSPRSGVLSEKEPKQYVLNYHV